MTNTEIYINSFGNNNFWGQVPQDVDYDVGFIGDSRNKMNAFLEVDLSEDTFEVPLMLLHTALNAKVCGYSKLVYYPDFYTTLNRSTGLSIVRALAGSRKLVKFITKTSVWYGCSGLIMDNHFNVMFITTATIQKNTEEGGKEYSLQKLMCKMSKEVFNRQDESLMKTVIKNVIPWYATNTISNILPVVSGFVNTNSINKADILIEDVPWKTGRVSPPSPRPDMQELLIKTIQNHSNDI